MTKKTITRSALLAGAVFLLFSPAAEAQRGRGKGPGRGPGWGAGGWGGGPRLRCARLLMWAHPDALKAKLALNDGQVARISKVRMNFVQKRVTVRAEIQKLRLQMRTLYESSDIPNEQKLLNLMRKIRGQRGKLNEERVKTHLRVMRILTKEQRVQLRAKCMELGPGRGFRGRPWGRGRRGPGGPGGPGPGGPGGW